MEAYKEYFHFGLLYFRVFYGEGYTLDVFPCRVVYQIALLLMICCVLDGLMMISYLAILVNSSLVSVIVLLCLFLLL